MRYEVIKEFKDKETNDILIVGSFYETEKKQRANELIKAGFLKGDEKTDKKMVNNHAPRQD
ncbi:hypothetical protein PANG_00004 [Paenibacillus phage PG1]|uniref:hypothetical protein n=1 Tax=Paenibacillus phage PG1 TaxID=754053 RepID=UPI0003425A7F|nr:hypothetical protein PANG_00004 [Paenibacillus phage PG1]AGN33725.1 hypothetical protein PANG_00004 [Paenibacillus phage PG1]